MKLIVITGQTATGKTKLAIEYAKEYNGELINCDSRQIYKHLDIITGKDLPPRLSSRANPDVTSGGVEGSVWLYDIVDPKQYFSSFDYVQHATPVINNILKKGKIPIIVGGTYLYIKHLLYGVETENIAPDWKLRKRLNEKSVEQLQQILKKLNLQSFKRLNNSDKNNPRRLIRRIEIEAGSNDTRRVSNLTPDTLRVTHIKFIGLKHKNKEKLIEAIEKRVGERLKNGAVDEVRQLLKKGYTENDPGLKTIGYQQLIAYLKGKLTKQEAINQWITDEIKYAKRQYTFMKKDPNIIWKTI